MVLSLSPLWGFPGRDINKSLNRWHLHLREIVILEKNVKMNFQPFFNFFQQRKTVFEEIKEIVNCKHSFTEAFSVMTQTLLLKWRCGIWRNDTQHKDDLYNDPQQERYSAYLYSA